MTGFDKIVMIAEKEYALAMNEVAHAQAIIESSLELNMQRAELKVLQESGSELDLLYLYEAAGADASKNTENQGFLKKITDALKNAITTVWNAIQKVFTGKNTEAYDALQRAKGKVKLNIPDPSELLGTVESSLSGISGKSGPAIIAAIVAAIPVLGIAINKFWNRKNKGETCEVDANKGNGLFATVQRILGHVDNIEKNVEAAPDEGEKDYKDENGNTKKGNKTGLFSEISTKVKDAALKIGNEIGSALQKIGCKLGIGGKDNGNGNGGNGANGQVNPSQGNAYDGMKEKDKNQMQQNLANAQGVANTDDNFDESVETKLDRLAAMLEGI